ncbi:MAG: DUF4270 family protein [Bacteroidetes bacterium]|nr:DUF4270 family protein [Bacteroidota bacterium]
MQLFKHKTILFCLLVCAAVMTACDKVDVNFGSTASTSDPNITYFDNYAVNIATYKPDSFNTSGHKIFSVGYHYDTTFGVVKAGAYVQIDLPATNPLLNVTDPVVFDSLRLLVRPNHQFYGDSTRPVKVNVYQLTENIKSPDNTDYYYNTTFFGYSPTLIGQQVLNFNTQDTMLSIKLNDALGQDLLTKFKNNGIEVTSQDYFINYLKGLYITTDSTTTNSIVYFSGATDSVLMRLSYHQNSLFPVAKTLDFNYTKEKQCNHISFRFTNPKFSNFINQKTQVIPSTSSGNQAFLNTNLAASVKISFPTLLSLKELHPYIKVVKAELIIRPDAKSAAFPYQLPGTLNLYATDVSNELLSGVFEQGTTTVLQNGNLVIDNLYNENTYYSYDITNFINNTIAEGQSSTAALMLSETIGDTEGGIQRLIVNDQNSNHSIQLKLYVLGL